nr:YraN family protein [uncultured Agathobaculum sp.]
MKGAWGEMAARRFLEQAGYVIVTMNFRTRFGEIDIIAQRGKYIVFVEVKARRNDRFAAAREHVTQGKQARILAAAEAWLQSTPSDLQPRFDVIEVYGEQDAPDPPRINHLENAFGG